MRLLKIFIFSLLCFALAANSSFAADDSQVINDLRQKIQELERQSAEYREQIKQKQQEGESLKKELDILDKQISQLRVRIVLTANKIEVTRLEIKELASQIGITTEKIEKNKSESSEILKNLYLLTRKDPIQIILANQRISDFFSQVQQINSLQAQLLVNLTAFKELKEEMKNKKELDEQKKKELEVLNWKQENQKSASESTKEIKGDLLVKTKGQEKKYQELLSEVEKQKAEFYKELQELEDAAREQGIYIVRIKAPSIPKRGTKLFKMPLDDFIITQGYGMTAFASRGVYGGAPHNGIDLTSGPGSEIRSIGSGTVLAKGFNNAAGYWIAIRHDNDLVSVYGHMKGPAIVGAEERVDENTVIGFEGATGFVTGSHLHLSLYHEFFTFIGPKTGQIYFNYWEGSLNPLDYM